MAILKLHEDLAGTVRIGDAVYSLVRDEDGVIVFGAPLHAGIFTGDEDIQVTGLLPQMQVSDRPAGKGPCQISHWNCGTNQGYRVDVVGQRVEDVDPIQVKVVATIAHSSRFDQSLLPGDCCAWSHFEQTRDVLDGIPLFVRGSCTHFVEYCYTHAGLPILNRTVTRDPHEPFRIRGATQVYVFAHALYNQEIVWRDELAAYPGCLTFDASEG
jgi:hypothetical protein